MNKSDKPAKSTLPHLSRDGYLAPYMPIIEKRQIFAAELEARLTGGKMTLSDFASGHEYFGLHRKDDQWIFREWAPNASAIYLFGDFTDWQQKEEFRLNRIDDNGTWEARFPLDRIRHGQLYKLMMYWHGGQGERLPSYARRVVQDKDTLIFSAQVWAPQQQYEWKNPAFKRDPGSPLIYEAHIGMAQEKAGVGTYTEFREHILPRIISAGYNTIQFMAIMEHPYYGSFGYHVSNFFAASSRFGTPEELKELIDAAHSAGIAVIMDLIHSHAANNEVEGLSKFDGTPYQYFHDGGRGKHTAWDSRLFDYGKNEVLHFLLSNCRYWLDEFKIDGFRFDGITSMIYHHHGLGPAFDSYDRYFDGSIDDHALAYLSLANKLIHTLRPDAMTVAEDVSGMPGLAAPVYNGGIGFDFRLAMGIPDCWFRLLRKVKDDHWHMGHLWGELTNRRQDEKTISYVESHDQAIVGDKTAIFEMIDAAMYHHMRIKDNDLTVDRGMALHKLLRLATISTAGHGYLNFIGNEFGHPEWIDFPREGNNWSYHYARRQWHLVLDPELKYQYLSNFDKAMIRIIRQFDILQKLPRAILINEGDKVLFFERSGFFFAFNFHPEKSFPEYGIECPIGTYSLEMDSDRPEFGGHNRIQPHQSFVTQKTIDKKSKAIRHSIRLYLPSRTALILKKTD